MKKATLFLILLLATQSKAQWTTNTLNNTPVCTYTDDDTNPVSVSDGAGGTIVVWEDRRSFAYDIYAQKMDANGVAQWTTNGIGVCTAGFDQLEPHAFPDGSGGAFIVWTDERFSSNDFIYAQHINSSGTALWAANGIKVSARSGCSAFDAIADGTGGFFISYFYSNSISSKIYAQRIDNQGIAQWASSDLVICNTIDQFGAPYPKMASDGSGGMIITWLDHRTPANNLDVYAQRINASGQIQWTANGIAVNAGVLDADHPYIVSDGTGGAIIAWGVPSNTPPQGIYAQRINSTGISQWPVDGVIVSTTHSDDVQLLADSNNGALVYWRDYRYYSLDPGSTTRVYTQKLDAQGTIQWDTNGVSINAIPNYSQYNAFAYSNGDGNFYFAYTQVSNTSVSGYNMLYLQKMAPNGSFLWSGNGVGLGTYGYYEHATPTIVPNNNGGMIVAFSKDAAIYEGNIYVQNVNADGTVGPNLSNASFDVEDVKMYPNPTHGLFMIESNSIIDTITVFDLLGKEVLTANPNSLSFSVPFYDVAKGVYFVKLLAGTKQTIKKLLVN